MRLLVNSLVAAAAATGCRESCENTLLECIADCNDSNCISECQRHSEDCFSSCDGDVHLLIFEPSSDPDSEVPVPGNQIKFSWNRQTGSEYVQNVPLNTPPEYDVYRKGIVNQNTCSMRYTVYRILYVAAHENSFEDSSHVHFK